MVPIRMVDLQQQYQKIKASVDAALLDVLDSCAFINGEPVQAFARELQDYLGVPYVIPCANGTDALQIAMMALGLQPGDEVITPSFTYIATVEVIALLRLKPVFVDVDPRTYCLDPNLVEQAITSGTRAIIPVHLYGQSAEMDPLIRLASGHRIAIIEDNAQAIGSDYSFPGGRTLRTGTMGTLGCTSFFPSKNLGCFGDGGALFTHDQALAEKARMIANHGQRVQYFHDLVGCNSRLDTIQAAVLRVKLPLLDGYIQARRAVADQYDQAFSGHPMLTIPFRSPRSLHVFHQYTLQVGGGQRDKLKAYLAEQSIPSMIYYPVPCHRQKMFEGGPGMPADLPETEHLAQRVLSLPIHTEMNQEQLDFISKHVLRFFDSL